MSHRNDVGEKLDMVVDAPRNSPPVLPMGFRVGVGKDICIVDLIDETHAANGAGNRYCFYSFSLTKSHAKELRDRLDDFIGD